MSESTTEQSSREQEREALRDARYFVELYARRNPRFEHDGEMQDPSGVNACLERIDAVLARPTVLLQDENSGREGRRYNEWHASRPDARLNAREAAASIPPTAITAEEAGREGEAKDGARLDWLEQQDLNDLSTIRQTNDVVGIHVGHGPYYGKTLRAAIDAAMLPQQALADPHPSQGAFTKEELEVLASAVGALNFTKYRCLFDKVEALRLAAPHPPVSAEAGKGATDDSAAVEWVSKWMGDFDVVLPNKAFKLLIRKVSSSQQREPQEAAERPANFTELWELYSRVGDAHENHGRNHEKTMEARATFHAALMRALSAPQEASKVEPVADERQPSDGDYLRWAEQAGAKINWDFESASSARVVFLTASQWGRFCDKVRALYLRPTQQALGEDAAGEFADWLCREMPPGTVISDPAWWAPKIMRAILAAAGGSEK